MEMGGFEQRNLLSVPKVARTSLEKAEKTPEQWPMGLE